MKALITKTFYWLRDKGSKKEKIGALVLLAFFLAISAVTPSQVSEGILAEGESLAMSPRFFPYVVTIVGAFMCLLILIRSFCTSGVSQEGEGNLGVKQIKRAGPVIVIAALYLFLFNVLGYMLSAILCFSLLLWYYGVSFRKEWAVVVPIIILLPLILYLVFKYQLYVSLPSGILPELPF